MKKILFIVFAVAGFSKFSIAQQAAKMTPAPSQAEVDKQTQAKMNEAKANPSKATDANMANYKKAGLDDKKVNELVSYTNQLERKKAAIKADVNLTEDQKKQQLAAVETERNAVLQRTMGQDVYKKYTELTPAAKPAPSKKATEKKTPVKATN